MRLKRKERVTKDKTDKREDVDLDQLCNVRRVWMRWRLSERRGRRRRRSAGGCQNNSGQPKAGGIAAVRPGCRKSCTGEAAGRSRLMHRSEANDGGFSRRCLLAISINAIFIHLLQKTVQFKLDINRSACQCEVRRSELFRSGFNARKGVDCIGEDSQRFPVTHPLDLREGSAKRQSLCCCTNAERGSPKI